MCKTCAYLIMKVSRIFTIGLLSAGMALGLLSCSSSKTKDCTAAREAARRDVDSVLVAPEGSMAREKAILAIRVRESDLRRHGYADAADSYIDEARHLLIDSLHIITPVK